MSCPARRRCHSGQTSASDVHDPRALAEILQKAEVDLAAKQHPDPYIRESSPETWFPFPELTCATPAPTMPSGTKWCVLVISRFTRTLNSYRVSRERNIPVSPEELITLMTL